MAVTIKNQLKGLLQAAGALLATKDVPDGLRKYIEDVQASLKSNWSDLATTTDAEESLSHRSSEMVLQTAIEALMPGTSVSVIDVFDDVVVFSQYDASADSYAYLGMFAAPYTLDDSGGASVGDPYAVRSQTEFVPVIDPQVLPQPMTEADTDAVTGDIIPLREAAISSDGTVPIKLIAPGWGSSGYYSPELLARDGAAAFPAGTQMFWDHQTEYEEATQPEGSLRDLAAVLVTDAKYIADHADGAGLYAKAKVFGDYRESLQDIGDHIGVSIRARGRSVIGEAEGRKGNLITALTTGKSVDFVTVPGAGGKIVSLFESHRGGQRHREESPMPNEDVTTLKEAFAGLQTQLATMQASLNAQTCRNLVEAVTPVALPAEVRQRVISNALAAGNGDTTFNYVEAVNAATKSELDYIKAVAGGSAVRGFGSFDTGLHEADTTNYGDELAALLAESGLDPVAAKLAVA